MTLFALAIAPGLAICLFIYVKDRYNREPLHLLLLSFLLGALSTLPALLIQIVSGMQLETLHPGDYLRAAFYAYCIVALSEEGCKLMFVRMFAFRKNAFDEPFDGIVYTVMTGMGFATLENIGYVYQHGWTAAVSRMFLAVPAHATFAILMGYHIGLARFSSGTLSRNLHFLKGLLLASILHGTYDFFLFTGNGWLSALGALASLYIGIRLSRRAISIHHGTSARIHLRSKAHTNQMTETGDEPAS